MQCVLTVERPQNKGPEMAAQVAAVLPTFQVCAPDLPQPPPPPCHTLTALCGSTLESFPPSRVC
jgi:hypothetical protein